ncbi:MAG: hypothetical protein IID42_05555 [Planctomycetes bacterium]|nr:hypothetical protein [Planctomycetota bacterium]
MTGDDLGLYEYWKSHMTRVDALTEKSRYTFGTYLEDVEPEIAGATAPDDDVQPPGVKPKPATKIAVSSEAPRAVRGDDGQRLTKPWEQSDLNNALQKFFQNNRKHIEHLAADIAAGINGSRKKARDKYGRNALGRRFSVKSFSMISKSPKWKGIAKLLKLNKEANTTTTGLCDISTEEVSIAIGDTTEADVLRREADAESDV